jgi:hypothetical protein
MVTGTISAARPAGKGRLPTTWWIRVSVATALAIGPLIGAVSLASTPFAAFPRLGSPGMIVIAAEHVTRRSERPVDVSVNTSVAAADGHTRLDIAVTQNPGSGTGTDSEWPLDVFLCGAIGQDPAYVDNQGQPVSWQEADPGHHVLSTSPIQAPLATCVQTRLVLPRGPVTGMRQVLLSGASGRAPSSVSGSRVLYALPGIGTLPMLPDTQVDPLPAGSTARLSLAGFPGDLTEVVASPQLPDAGILNWTTDLSGPRIPAREYRLSGTLHDRDASGQRDLFLAGALVGVAGGAVVWLVELLLDGALDRRTRQRRPTALPDTASAVATATGPEPGGGERSGCLPLIAGVLTTAALIWTMRRAFDKDRRRPGSSP